MHYPKVRFGAYYNPALKSPQRFVTNNVNNKWASVKGGDANLRGHPHIGGLILITQLITR